ncbi:MAG: hypothetical protein DHS20C10_12030 [marine bacterium B5-7]|nr:MAG: hypothetical protein DHS20C10_12030 [marine bacterium B5-7]
MDCPTIRLSTQTSKLFDTLRKEALYVPGANVILKESVIICVQHLLETNILLFEALLIQGFRAENIFIKGKPYSTHEGTRAQLRKKGIFVFKENHSYLNCGDYAEKNTEEIINFWREILTTLKNKPNIRNLIVVDDGGKARELIPKRCLEKYNVLSIEQTQYGVNTLVENITPYISVATSKTKKEMESGAVAQTIIEKLKKNLKTNTLPNNWVYGVIGYGAIGAALTRQLIKNGLVTHVYDKQPVSLLSPAKNHQKIENCINESDIIFGCTGNDISKAFNFQPKIKKHRILVSCSSEEKEFLTLLRKEKKRKDFILEKVRIDSETNSPFTILNGGYPINFDLSATSVPLKDIRLTRALIYAAIIQATRILSNKDDIQTLKKPIALDNYFQTIITEILCDKVDLECLSIPSTYKYTTEHHPLRTLLNRELSV